MKHKKQTCKCCNGTRYVEYQKKFWYCLDDYVIEYGLDLCANCNGRGFVWRSFKPKRRK